MSSVPYAAVTCLDTATCIGPVDATIIPLDYRYAGEVSYVMSFIGTLASVGAADSVRLQVSPDYRSDAASNAGAMWQTIEVFASTAFNGTLNGPWSAIRFFKVGDQTGKVVALVAGKHRAKYGNQG